MKFYNYHKLIIVQHRSATMTDLILDLCWMILTWILAPLTDIVTWTT